MKGKQSQTNGHTKKPFSRNYGPHLISKLANNDFNSEKDETLQCKYGIYCAHLRMNGKCQFLHRRNHFHFLNLVPPLDCLEDEEEEEKKLSKKERKERKVIEKTINKEIDVADLDRKEQLLKNKSQAEAKKELIQQLDQSEQKVIELANCQTVIAFFEKLNALKEGNFDIYEIKRKSMMQIKKKNQSLYTEIIDKEYRIANRLIKADEKNQKFSLHDLYKDINHDTIPSVREYFDAYLDEEKGIPQQKGEKLLKQEKLYLSELLSSVFKAEPSQFENQTLFIQKISAQKTIQMKANAIFYNMLVPFKMTKNMPFSKYFYADFEEHMTFARISSLLNQEYTVTFHGKFKAPPEYAFGQLEQNQEKFKTWALKLLHKFTQAGTEFKTVFIFDNLSQAGVATSINQFEEEKLRQKVSVFQTLRQIFTPIVILLLPENKKKAHKKICETLSIDFAELESNLLTI